MPSLFASRRHLSKPMRWAWVLLWAGLAVVLNVRTDAMDQHGAPIERSTDRQTANSDVLRSSDVAVGVLSQQGIYHAFVAGLQRSGIAAACPELDDFTLTPSLAGPGWIFEASVQTLVSNGLVTIQGLDTREPGQPFTFDWGDGSTSEAFFPANHQYKDTSRNYRVGITAHYDDFTTAQTETHVWFRPFAVNPVATDPSLAVGVPTVAPSLATRLYPAPSGLAAVSEGTFGSIGRETASYVLSVAAQLQYSYANNNVEPVGSGFEQVVLADPSLEGGMYSLWFTTPVALAVGHSPLRLESEISSVFHEMGHNVTLNSPAAFRYGGRVDGSANAIFSEAMAQIFQHATAYDLVREGDTYGLGCDLREAIRASGLRSFAVLRVAHEDYLAGGMRYSSWNDPATPNDETFGTFMTIAFKFFEHAEEQGNGVEVPLRRMMALLQTFDADLAARYDQTHNTSAAAAFRATLMVAAPSEAFDEDLREEFRGLGFPIDNDTYDELRARQ